MTSLLNYFVASKTESQGVPVPSPSQSPEAAKANAAPAPAASQGAPVPSPSRSPEAAKANAAPAPAASQSAPVPSPSQSSGPAKAKAAPAPAASQSAPVAPAPYLSDFKNKCVEVMFAWGSRDGEYSGYSDNFYDLLEACIAHGDEAHDDKAIEDFLCDEGISAYMKGYVSSETSVYLSDAANWLEILALPDRVHIIYSDKFPNAWCELMKKYGDDEDAVTKVLRQRRAQLKRKKCYVIEELQVSFIINYACI